MIGNYPSLSVWLTFLVVSLLLRIFLYTREFMITVFYNINVVDRDNGVVFKLPGLLTVRLKRSIRCVLERRQKSETRYRHSSGSTLSSLAGCSSL